MKASDKSLLKKLIVISCCMFGFGYALVPFYKKICEVTGVNNIASADSIESNTQVDISRTVTVEFDSNIRSDLPWTFRPLQKSISLHPGQLVQILYEVKNISNASVMGQAIPSYAPQLAALYFRKLECFCFRQQTLKPLETRRMPVVFVVSRNLPRDVHTITLSYTFFAIEGSGKTSASG